MPGAGPRWGLDWCWDWRFWVKWTAAAFVIGPLTLLVLRAEVLQYAWRHPRALLPRWRWLALALLAGVAAIGLWLGLAQDVVATLRLGWCWCRCWACCWGACFMRCWCRMRTAGVADACAETPAVQGERLRNVLGAGVVAAFVIALWYLTNIEFLNYFLFTAYGREEEPFYAFGKYLGEVVNEQLGPWFALVFVVVVVVWAWQAWRRRRKAGSYGDGARACRLRRGIQRLSDIGWVLLLWVVVPYFVFSFRVTLAHSRICMPFLPPFAIWMAVGLMQWRPPDPALGCHCGRAAAGYFAICSDLV